MYIVLNDLKKNIKFNDILFFNILSVLVSAFCTPYPLLFFDFPVKNRQATPRKKSRIRALEVHVYEYYFPCLIYGILCSSWLHNAHGNIQHICICL